MEEKALVRQSVFCSETCMKIRKEKVCNADLK